MLNCSFGLLKISKIMSLIVFLVFHNNYLPLVYWFWRRSCLNIVVALFYYGDIISLEELMTWTFIGKKHLKFHLLSLRLFGQYYPSISGENVENDNSL